MLINQGKIKISKDFYIILFFSILPLIDTLNGVYHSLPLGIVYKIILCMFLFLNSTRCGKFRKKYAVLIIASIAYVGMSIVINMALGGKLVNSEYPIKLIFNIVLLCLLLNEISRDVISGETIYKIIRNGSWILIMCYLIPYVLGVGNIVYSGGMGYKGFFISQNELSLVIVVMLFFTAYRLIYNTNVWGVLCLALLFLCAMLLNTKTTIISGIIAICLWIIPILLKSKVRTKIIILILIALGFCLLKDKIFTAISASINRYLMLVEKHYGGSSLTGVLSARNYYLSDAWNGLNNSHTILRLIIGNGFCSDVLIEMDLFDIFFFLGIIGLLVTIIFLYIVFKVAAKKVKQDGCLIRPLSFLVIIILLTLAGHVLFMSMSGCYFILYVCFITSYKQLHVRMTCIMNKRRQYSTLINNKIL